MSPHNLSEPEADRQLEAGAPREDEPWTDGDREQYQVWSREPGEQWKVNRRLTSAVNEAARNEPPCHVCGFSKHPKLMTHNPEICIGCQDEHDKAAERAAAEQEAINDMRDGR